MQARYFVFVVLALSLSGPVFGILGQCCAARDGHQQHHESQLGQLGQHAEGRPEGTLLPAATSDRPAIEGTSRFQSMAKTANEQSANSTVRSAARRQKQEGDRAAHHCLSLNVYWEARNQSVAGQIAVAQVTVNRALDPRFPNDVCEVVYDHKQFSWYWDGKSDWPVESGAWEVSKLIASAAMAGTGHAELQGVTHYHAVYSQPYWRDSMTQVTIIGDHIFYSDSPQTRSTNRY